MVTAAVPRTGQLLCYDVSGREIPCAGSGQDGELRRGLASRNKRFSEEGETVADAMTGLTWMRDGNPAGYPLSWQEAHAFIGGLNDEHAAGHGDWRLPAREELRGLLDCQRTRPPLPEGHPFRNVFAGWYWTATEVATRPGYAWYVHLGGGRVFYGDKGRPYLVWPVRGEARRTVAPPAPARFDVRGETVRDLFTGLTWRRRAARGAGGGVDWTGALAEVRRLGGVARGTWRLPNINELVSLVDLGRFAPALPAGHPFEDTGNEYWSSTTSVFEPDWAWALYLEKGAVGVGRKDFARFGVWAVREEEEDV